MPIYESNLEQTDYSLYTSLQSRDSIEDIVTLEDIKSFTRQDDDYDAKDLQSFVFASIDYAEQYMGRYLSSAVIIGEFKDYYGELYLPYDPSSITSLTGENIYGVTEDIDFTFSKVRSTVKININNYSGYKNFTITYQAGYQDGEIPEQIKYGIKRMAATMFESRQEEIYGVSATGSAIKTNRFFDLYRLRGA